MNKSLKSFIGIVSVTPVLFLLGLALSLFLYIKIPIHIFHGALAINILLGVGAVFIFLGTVLAFLAQRVSRVVSRPTTKATCPDLMGGPYKYSRHPGALALIIMYVGFVLVTNSLPILILVILFILLLTFIFVPMEEKVIMGLCPEAYTEYRTKVRMWF